MGRSISTKTGDKGTTGLLYGGRVRKDSVRVECNGAVDEAQAAVGLARAQLASAAGGPRGGGSRKGGAAGLAELLVSIERDLWVLMAEVATAPRNRAKLVAGSSLVTAEMVDALEALVHELEADGAMPAEFVVPGEDPASAALDVARTVVRRAERLAVRADLGVTSQVVPYLNRLSDLLWLVARSVEQHHRTARTSPRRKGAAGADPGDAP
ncbi:MAG: cob(I)yrinic acid a,c-diamide adenosyltransferase [Acidimicrobiales bacterium]